MKVSHSGLGMLVGGGLLGFALGWGLKPVGERGEEIPSTKSHREVVASAKSSNGPDANRWMEGLKSGGFAAAAREMGDDEFGAMLEEVLAGMWGGIGHDDAERIHALIGEWVERDLAGCLGWARGLEDRAWREAGLLAIVNALGESDAVAALKIYCEIDRITLAGLSNVNGEHWEEALASIAEESGPEGVAAILNHLPLEPTLEESGFVFRLSMDFNAPGDFDFEELMRLAPEAGRLDGAARHLTVELLGDWAKRDFEGSWSHVMQRMKDGDSMKWGTLLRDLERTESRELAVRTAMESIQEMPAALQGDYLESSWMWESILDSVPEMDARMEMLSGMARWSSEGPFGEDRWVGYAERIGVNSDVFVKNMEKMKEKE